MGKNMGRREPRIHLAGGHQGCMNNILHALHHNHWHSVKKMLPHKRLGGGSRHAAIVGDPGNDNAATDIGEVQENIDAESNKLHIEEKVPELISRKKEKATEPSSTTKSSMKSRIKALIADEKFKRKGRHRRSTSCPVQTQVDNTNPEPNVESRDSDAELSSKDECCNSINGNSSGASTSDPLLPKPHEEPVSKKKTCELCAAMLSMTYWKQIEADDQWKQSFKGYPLLQESMISRKQDLLEHKSTCAQEVNEGASPESNQFMDTLDIFGTRKEFFRKILQNPGSPLVNYLQNRQAFNSKKGLTKSVSFPVAGSAWKRTLALSHYNESHESTKSKSTEHMGECRVHGYSIPMLGRAKSSSNLPPCSPRGLKTKHENKPVIKRFKNLRHKISHAIRESRKEKKRIVMDSVFHKIPYDRKSSKVIKEKTLNNQSACFVRKQFDIDNQCFRRTTSFGDSLDKYCRLFESCCTKEPKHQCSERLKLTPEERPPPCKSSGKSLERILSLPDLRFYSVFQMEDSPGPSGTAARTCLERSASKGSIRLDEEKATDLSADQESEKQLDAPAESGGVKNLIECSEALDDLDNLTTGKSISHHQDELEATERPVNLEPSPDFEVKYNSEEDTTISIELSTTEADYLASLQHDTGIDSLTLVDSTVDIQRTETPVNQNYGDFLHDRMDIKDIAEFNYVKDVLELSGFSGNEFLGTWHSMGQPLDPEMFQEMEDCFLAEHESSENEEVCKNNHLLLFDLINEVLLEIYDRSFAYFPMPLTCRSHISPMPVGHHVLQEVWTDISWYLSWRPENYQSLDDAVSRDLAKDDRWMNLQFDTECVGIELEDMIFDDLLDELLYDDLLEELMCL